MAVGTRPASPAEIYAGREMRAIKMRDLDELLKELRMLDPERAAEAIILKFPRESDNAHIAFELIPRLSWSRRAQVTLCHHYLQDTPHGNDKGYHIFLKIMAPAFFLRTFGNMGPFDEKGRGLMEYYLKPLIREINVKNGWNLEFEDFFHFR
ncbi:MAG: hypothetical protein AAFR52_10705 [Pseudomonadota bacterium]